MSIRFFAFRVAAFLSLGAFLFSGCSTELDSNADFKEVLVIYSILDPGQTTHYAKVNMAFLNSNTNALTIAANHPDSVQYGDQLLVKLQELGPDSAVVQEHIMERFVATGKEPGIFFSGEQVIYRTTGIVNLNDQAIYRVLAINTETGVSANGVTEIVKQKPSDPTNGLCIEKISLAYSANNSCITESQPSKFEPHMKFNNITFHQAPNAKIYTVKMMFKYAETTDNVRQEKQIEWYVRSNFIVESDKTEPSINQEDNYFINNLMALIDRSGDNATTTREAGDVFVTVTAGSPSLELYYRINNSFSIISQTRPEFDNISNGTGLVGSRLTATARGYLTQDAISYLVANTQLRFRP